MDNKELASILEKAKAGNNDAISAIVKEYSGRVYNMAKIYGGDGVDAKTVAVRSFAKAIRNIDSLKDPAGFEEYLYGYVRQEAMKAQKKEKPAEGKKTMPPVPGSGKDSVSIPAFKPEPVEETAEPEYEPVPAEKAVDKEKEEPEEDAEDIPEPPVKQAKKRKKVIEEEEDDEDYDEDEEDDYDEERGGFPGWLLVILIVLAIIILVCLGMYFFMPELWDTIAESANDRLPFKLPYAEKTEEEEDAGSVIETAAPLATLTAAPVESIESTATPTVDAESILEGGDAAPLTTPTPTPEATPTPTPAAVQQASGTIGKVTVNVDNLNIRASASTSSESKGHATQGTTYDVYETASADGYTWYRIGTDQWIASDGTWAVYTAG